MNLRWKIAQAAEIRWWRRYLQKKSKAEYLAAKRVYWLRVLKTLGIQPKSGDRVLDAGCGPAGIFIVLDNCLVDAVDPLLDQYEYLPHFKRIDYPNVHFYNKRLEQFKKHDAYDVVFCLNAINHVADLKKSLDNLVDMLAPGGRLIISIDAHRNDFLKAIFRAIPGDILHPHQHDVNDYIKMLEHRRCQVLKTIRLKPGRIFDYYAIIATK